MGTVGKDTKQMKGLQSICVSVISEKQKVMSPADAVGYHRTRPPGINPLDGNFPVRFPSE